MKTIFTSILLIFASFHLAGQTINIPDDILKEYLTTRFAAAPDLDSTFDIMVDANGDGEIQVSEAEAIVALKVPNQDFTNPEGLQYFKNLRYLDLRGNEMNTIDLSPFTKLEFLDLGGNLLTTVDLSKQLALQVLDIAGNELTDIDLSKNKQLIDIEISGNKWSSLIISDLPELQIVDPLPSEDLKNLTISNNPKLEEIKLNLSFGQNHEFDNLVISNNAILESLVTDQINTINLDCSNNPFSSLNLLPFTKLKTLKFTGELHQFQGTAGVILPAGVHTVNVQDNHITSLLFVDWNINNYNFDTSSDLIIQIRNASKNLLRIHDAPSVVSITQLGNAEDLFNFLDLKNLPNLEKLVLQQHPFDKVELIDFPKLSTLKITANEIYLEKLGIKSYDSDYTQADVRLFVQNKITFKNCPELKDMEILEENLDELNLLDLPAGTELEIVDGSYETINIRSSKFNTCLLYTSPSPRDQRGSRMPSSA